jgi:hypothetical protein
VARIALDIDSTLHHYWDQLERVVSERHGVALPYAEQRSWGIGGLEQGQVAECLAETHSDENILAAEPYPDAVQVVARWHADGHWIHVTSHRAHATRGATERWLGAIGLPYDDLHLSYDKLSRCVELGIDVLVDDSPENITGARAAGILAATIAHPWNEGLLDRDGVIGAPDWRGLERRLAPVLAS